MVFSGIISCGRDHFKIFTMERLNDVQNESIVRCCFRLFIVSTIIFTVRVLADVDRQADDGGFSAQFIVINDARLYGNLLMYLEDYEFSSCTAMCVRHRRCETVNYNAEQKVCEVLGDKFDEVEAVKEPGWINYGTPNKVDGGYSSWGHGPCSVTCGFGVRVTWRTCTNPVPKYGGQQCDGSDRKTLSCHEKHCPVNGEFGEWSAFTVCNVTCGGGTKTRTRKCDSPEPKHGGVCIGEASETKECNSQGCHVKNLALRKQTFGKYLSDHYHPDRAVDGNDLTHYKSSEPWWAVDFIGEIYIHNIIIKFHEDYIDDRISIEVGKIRGDWLLCDSVLVKKSPVDLTCDPLEPFVKLRISQNETNEFILYEVQVFGYNMNVSNVALRKNTNPPNYKNGIDGSFSSWFGMANSWWSIEFGSKILLRRMIIYCYYISGSLLVEKYVDRKWSTCFQYTGIPLFTGITCNQESSEIFSKLKFIQNGGYANFHEVMVYGFYVQDRVNLAIKKNPVQSSTEGSHDAGKAVDEDGVTFSSTLSNQASPPWWYVDLNELCMIHKIFFYLNVGENDHATYNELVLYSREREEHEWKLFENKVLAPKNNFPDWTFMNYRRRIDARFINVTLTINKRLSIKEIIIYGFPLRALD